MKFPFVLLLPWARRLGTPRLRVMPGGDKVIHFMVPAVLEVVSYAVLRRSGSTSRASITGAMLITTGISIGKELVDQRRTGRFSVRDLA